MSKVFLTRQDPTIFGLVGLCCRPRQFFRCDFVIHLSFNVLSRVKMLVRVIEGREELDKSGRRSQ